MARLPRRTPGANLRIGGDTIYAGIPGRMNTVYGGIPDRTNDACCTIYGGKTGRADTVYGGGKVTPGSGPVSVQVIHPQTRQPMTVMYNPATKLFLDNKTKSWKPAPTWMRSQIR